MPRLRCLLRLDSRISRWEVGAAHNQDSFHLCKRSREEFFHPIDTYFVEERAKDHQAPSRGRCESDQRRRAYYQACPAELLFRQYLHQPGGIEWRAQHNLDSIAVSKLEGSISRPSQEDGTLECVRLRENARVGCP